MGEREAGKRRRVAVVGSGIAGIAAADRLSDTHDVTLFEAEDRLGGHTNTVTVDVDGREVAVDTGFIVFNERNYPTFCDLLDRWQVKSQPSDMSFSVSVTASKLEYSGAGLNGVFAQRRNLVSPSYYSLLREILRFGTRGRAALLSGELSSSVTTAEFLAREGFSSRFRELYLIPLGAAVWSANPEQFPEFPAAALLQFLDNHGLLLFRDRPKWRTIVGGSARYLEAFEARNAVEIRRSCPVTAVTRRTDAVLLATPEGEEVFDEVILATHSDDALRLLTDPTPEERAVLGAVRYQSNEVVLHSDVAVLPRRRAAWASWNYFLGEETSTLPTVTYWMNRLQSLELNQEILVTLNRTSAIDPAKIRGVFTYRHPTYDVGAFEAQNRFEAISGKQHTFYAGAWWGYGFHEDGARSGRRAADQLLS